MPRDALTAMRTTIEHGPGYCPTDLFAGEPRAVLAGLKAHANTIAHARHVALEETYPQTRALMGAVPFHAVAAQHLGEPATLRHPIARIGAGFADRLTGAAADLARVEWAWLEAHGAVDAAPFDLAALAGRKPEAIAAALVARHPAACALRLGTAVSWYDALLAPAALIARPDGDVVVAAISPAEFGLFESVTCPTPFAELLARDAEAAIRLVTLGALTEEIAA